MKLKDKELVGLAEAYNKVLENIFEPKEAAMIMRLGKLLNMMKDKKYIRVQVLIL